MDEKKIEEEFATKLNSLVELDESDVDTICWFIEDFSRDFKPKRHVSLAQQKRFRLQYIQEDPFYV